nr:MAG TPA: hypothetical protein [Caudoviricetes sp.]
MLRYFVSRYGWFGKVGRVEFVRVGLRQARRGEAGFVVLRLAWYVRFRSGSLGQVWTGKAG